MKYREASAGGYLGGAPKEDIDTCLNCPLERPMCGADACPLRAARAETRRKRKGKKHDRRGTDQGPAGNGEQKQAGVAG